MKLTSTQLLAKLKAAGTDKTKKTYMNHGAQEPCYGVKVEDMKKIMKGVDRDTTVALELFNSKVFDAMYFAGLYGDGATMTTKQLDGLANTAYGAWASEFSVPWLATENAKGFDLALKWIDSKKEPVKTAGWATLCSMVAFVPDKELNIPKLTQLLGRVQKEIISQSDPVKSTMNRFVLYAGTYVPKLTATAVKTAKQYGTVTITKDKKQVPLTSPIDYIEKMKKAGTIGKKRKIIKC